MILADDADGRPTIWDGDRPVADRDGDRIRIDMRYADVVWPVLTAVLTPGETTVERLARVITDDCTARNVDGACPACRREANERTHAILTALSEAS